LLLKIISNISYC